MPYKQGDTATDPATGEIIVFDGENWQDQPPSTLKDVGHSALAGLGHGVAQLVGLPFSLADLAARGGRKLAESTVGEGTFTKGFDNIRRDVAPLIGTKLEEYGEKGIPAAGPDAPKWQQDISSVISNKPVPGMDYQPQTGWGQVAHTAGEWAPAILGGGAGALARGGLAAGTRALAKGATSALGSEGAGQLAHEYTPDWEPAARMVGALAGYRAPTTVGNIAERVTAPSAARITEVNDKLAAYDKKYKPTQAKPNEYWELKKEQASHPAYTAPAASADAPKSWADTIGTPLGYGTGYVVANHLFPGNAEIALASILGAGATMPKIIGKATGAATKGTFGALGQELKQDPLTPAWLTAARAVPALEQESQ